MLLGDVLFVDAEVSSGTARLDTSTMTGESALLPISTLLATIFTILFVRTVRSGQFEDLDDAAQHVLNDD